MAKGSVGHGLPDFTLAENRTRLDHMPSPCRTTTFSSFADTLPELLTEQPGIPWRQVGQVKMADRVLGQAEP
jgi:hypothetical protein